VAIMSALSLHLNPLNLFRLLLTFFGQQQESSVALTAPSRATA
jgi:FtsH-binding integral membrane protein